MSPPSNKKRDKEAAQFSNIRTPTESPNICNGTETIKVNGIDHSGNDINDAADDGHASGDAGNGGGYQQEQEMFLQAFERPTQIYRFLRIRHYTSPVFLNRTLSYMRDRMSRNHKNRGTFSINSMLEKVSDNHGIVHKQFLNIIFIGIFTANGQGLEEWWQSGDVLNIETILYKIIKNKRKDSTSNFQELLRTNAQVIFNPSATQLNMNYKDNVTVTIPVTNMISAGEQHSIYKLIFRINTPPKYNMKQLMDIDVNPTSNGYSPTTTANSKFLNGASNMETTIYGCELIVFEKNVGTLPAGDYETIVQEISQHNIKLFSPKKRSWESIPSSSHFYTSNEYVLFQRKPILKFRLTWSHGGKVHNIPGGTAAEHRINFIATSTNAGRNATAADETGSQVLNNGIDEPAEATVAEAALVQNMAVGDEIPEIQGAAAEVIKENSNLSSTSSRGSCISASSLSLTSSTSSSVEVEMNGSHNLVTCAADDDLNVTKASTAPCSVALNCNSSNSYSLTPSAAITTTTSRWQTEKIQIVYNFIYNNNTRQQTEFSKQICCPWCNLNCLRLYSLLKHLKLCHARFNFTYYPTTNGAHIDVTINDSYDGSYAGSPYAMAGPAGTVFARLCGPVRRTPVTYLLVSRPRRQKTCLEEFLVPDEDDLNNSRPYITGHNRLYHHTETCLPVDPKELDVDSEGENDPLWLRQKTKQMIDEFSDVNEGEKEIMKLWNLHVMKFNFVGDCQMLLACEMFLKSHGEEIIRKNLYRNFILHLATLFDYSIISPDTVARIIQQLQCILSTYTEGQIIMREQHEAQTKYWDEVGRSKQEEDRSRPNASIVVMIGATGTSSTTGARESSSAQKRMACTTAVVSLSSAAAVKKRLSLNQDKKLSKNVNDDSVDEDTDDEDDDGACDANDDKAISHFPRRSRKVLLLSNISKHYPNTHNNISAATHTTSAKSVAKKTASMRDALAMQSKEKRRFLDKDNLSKKLNNGKSSFDGDSFTTGGSGSGGSNENSNSNSNDLKTNSAASSSASNTNAALPTTPTVSRRRSSNNKDAPINQKRTRLDTRISPEIKKNITRSFSKQNPASSSTSNSIKRTSMRRRSDNDEELKTFICGNNNIRGSSLSTSPLVNVPRTRLSFPFSK